MPLHDIVIAIIMIPILFVLYMRFEAGWVKVSKIRFTEQKDCLKILHMSDIHIKRMKVSKKKIRTLITAQKPDLIVLTGDYIEHTHEIPLLIDFLHQTLHDYPVYLCLGNHDHKAYKHDQNAKNHSQETINDFIDLLKAQRMTVLRNQSVFFEKGSKKYQLTGIDDLREGTPCFSSHPQKHPFPITAHIGITHNPDLVTRLPKGSVDYLLCGHYHGGQIWVPFDFEFRLLRKDELCQQGIKKGLHCVNEIQLYISRGLGNVCVPLRFLSRPEITVYHLP